MKLQCPINKLSYGVCGSNIAHHLSELTDTIIYPIGQPDMEVYQDIQHLDWRNKLPLEPIRHAYYNSVTIKLWHQNGLHEMVDADRRIGFPIFELDIFTREELLSLNHCDELIVCSEWARQVVKNNNIDIRTHVVPLGVDRAIFNENNNFSRPETIFFNGGKWEIRKGHDILLKCFNRAFEYTDNVELWMMPENPFIGEKNNEWIKSYKTSKLGSKVRIIPRQNTQKDVYNIMRQVDVGVFPARAEGWNLEILELLACGKHVITTNYAGHTEYLNEDNAMLVNTNFLESAYDGIWFFKQGNWASITEDMKDQFIEYMRSIHKSKIEGTLELNRKGIDTSREFSWASAANKIYQLIGE